MYSLFLSLKPVTFQQGVGGKRSPAKVLENVTWMARTTAGQYSIAEPVECEILCENSFSRAIIIHMYVVKSV